MTAHVAGASQRPGRSRRTFFFQVGRVVSISKRGSRCKPGAMMHSMNRPGSVIAQRGRFVDFAVETEHAAVGAERIALVGMPERLDQRLGDRGAAGIVVLDDHGRRLGEFADQVQGAIEIEQSCCTTAPCRAASRPWRRRRAASPGST